MWQRRYFRTVHVGAGGAPLRNVPDINGPSLRIASLDHQDPGDSGDRRSVLLSGGPVRLNRHLGEEAFDFAAQIGGCLFHRFRCGEHGLRRLFRFGDGVGHFAQHRDDHLGAVGGACHVLQNLAGRGGLLLHRRGRVYGFML